MHQQVRTSTTKTGSSSGGPGAMADRGGLVDILEVLLDAGVNLQAAGGRDLGRGGEFVFSVHHEDDDVDDDAAGEKAAALLREQGYRARAVRVHHCLVDDQPGSLLACIREAEAKQGPVNEIFVGTPVDGRIPLQVTSRSVQANERLAS